MHQLLFNLMSNSLKFNTPGRNPVISLVYKVTSEWNEQLGRNSLWHNFLLSDNGIGFNQAYADKIFLLFQRLHGKEQYAGSGIGLSVCKKIVENMEGRIYVSSIEGEGTTFTIQLPKAEIKKL
jgi:light-regulated signal transduction histidine kinase (bacteriophytochrome)